MDDSELHKLAREVAATLEQPDKKHLRFNDIVRVAKLFYKEPEAGVRELVLACDKSNLVFYDKTPMWESLEDNYNWMLEVT